MELNSAPRLIDLEDLRKSCLMDDMNVCEGCLEPRRMPACRIVHVALMLLLWTAPVLTSVYWNPGDDILRHNNEFTEVLWDVALF